MKCKVCGAQMTNIDGNKYICNYCKYSYIDEKVTVAHPDVILEPDTTKKEPENVLVPEIREPMRVLSGEEIYDITIDSVLEIYSSNASENTVQCSSGFMISELGFILTNAHAVLDSSGNICDTINIKTNDGKVYNAQAVAVGKPVNGKSNSIDLALLYSDSLSIKPNSIGDSDLLKNGQKVYVIGNSLGEGTCITSGIISDRARKMPGLNYTYIMTDAAANHGNSGGPLLNELGEIIGILVAGIDGAKGMNYAIPSNVIDSFLSYVVNNSAMKNANISELNKYSSTSEYSLSISVVFQGVKLLLDAIEYIVGLIKRKK